MYSPSPEECVERLCISDQDWQRGITCLQSQPFLDESIKTLIHVPGLYHHGIESDGDDLRRVSTRLAGVISVDARIQDEESMATAALLICGGEIEKIIWLGDLIESKSKALRLIADAGVWISLKGQHLALVAEWLMSEALTSPRQVLLYRKTGWYRGAFRLPHVAYGTDIASLVPSQDIRDVGYGMAGTLDEWRVGVGKTLVGNPAVIFAVGVALSGSLIEPTGSEGGGFHLYGESGRGKSTLLELAASVWGCSELKKSWAATANGKLSLYGAMSGTCVVMDELHESSDPRAISREIYALNGTPKTRGRPGGGTTSGQVYKVAFLSSGESSIADFLSAHKVPKLMPGAAKRLINLEVTNRRYGVFDDTHGVSPKVLADSIRRSAAQSYGTAGPAFVESLVRELSINPDFARSALALVMESFSGDERVARRFALAGLAVELAVSWGIVPLNSGDGLSAAIAFFDQWGASREPDMEPQDAIWEFINQYGCDSTNPDSAIAKWGELPIYRKWLNGQSYWLLPPKTFVHALGGRWSVSDAKKKLTQCGWLIGGKTKMHHINTIGHAIRVNEILIPEDYVPANGEEDRAEIIAESKSPRATECVTALPVKSDPNYQHDDLAFLVWADDVSQTEVSTCEEADHETWVGWAPEFVEDDGHTDGGGPDTSAILAHPMSIVVTKDVPKVVRRSMGDVITEAVLSGGDSW